MNRAAARTTTLNEQYLRRVSADIHDARLRMWRSLS